jgi:DNA primase
MIPDAIVDEVRARADIVEIIGEHVQLRRAGKDFKALCPFHNEKTPSFYVVPAKGIYKCFACQEAGNVFTFLMKRAGLSFGDAVRQIANRVGVEIPETGPAAGEDPNRRIYEAIAFAADHFQRILREDAAGESARQYLEQRGVKQEACERFLLGYAPDEWRRLRETAHKHGITDDVLLAAGLIKNSERSEEPYDCFRDRITFPIADGGGRVIAFGGRILSRAAKNAPKYLNSPETAVYQKGRILYGLNWSKGPIRREGKALVVEGYMDYVSLAARGVENVVAGMGTALTPEQANLLARYTGKVYLLYDSDSAGLRATFRSADALLRAGVHPLVVSLPAGEDPDSLVRKHGAAALQPLLDEAADVMDRKIRMLEERGFFLDSDGQRRALDRLLPTLRSAIDPALRDIYIARVEERTHVRRETLEQELATAPESAPYDAPFGGYRRGASQDQWPARRPASHGSSRREARAAPRLPRGEAERLLVLLMLRDPAWIAPASAQIAAADLHDPAFRTIFEALVTGVPEGVPTDAEAPVLEALAALRADPTEITNVEHTFRDVVAELRQRQLNLQLEQLRRRLAGAEDEEKEAIFREAQAIGEAIREVDPRKSLRFLGFARLRANRVSPSTEGG